MLQLSLKKLILKVLTYNLRIYCMKIKDLNAREILDSRGNPTVEAELLLENGIVGLGKVPSGASTGSREALELRDLDKRFSGRGVTKAIHNIDTEIKNSIKGKDITDIQKLDNILIELDNTENKSRLGANAILGVSMAIADACARVGNIELYHCLNNVYYKNNQFSLPVPLINIINGGAHADNSLDIQEFMIVPHGASSFKEAIRYGAEVFHSLKQLLKQAGHSTSVGDEGGFAPNIASNAEVIETIIKAINQAGFKVGKDIDLALDVASSEFYKNGSYHLSSEQKVLTNEQMVKYLANLANNYPIVSIEDALAEDDWEGWKILTEELGNKIQLVGDDLFVTNTKILSKGIRENIANSILIKMNQIGTISETFAAIKMAQAANYSTIISHRSGETEDTTIADIAVASNAKQIKTGSVCRSERVAKYNRLIKIEEQLGTKAQYAGKELFK